jgi:hypothetical protein
MRRRRAVLGILTIAALLSVPGSGRLEARAQDAAVAPDARPALAPPTAETGVAPRPPKERMEVAVLLAWVWLSIAVLFWIVRQMVREADRLARMGLKRPAGPGPERSRD